MAAINDRNKCCYCAGCPIVCPVGAIELIDEVVVIDKEKCTNCMACVKICPVGAMSIER